VVELVERDTDRRDQRDIDALGNPDVVLSCQRGIILDSLSYRMCVRQQVARVNISYDGGDPQRRALFPSVEPDDGVQSTNVRLEGYDASCPGECISEGGLQSPAGAA